MTDKKVCKIEPIRAEVYNNGILYKKPCGVKYSENYEVYCKKHEERTCEYIEVKKDDVQK